MNCKIQISIDKLYRIVDTKIQFSQNNKNINTNLLTFLFY